MQSKQWAERWLRAPQSWVRWRFSVGSPLRATLFILSSVISAVVKAAVSFVFPFQDIFFASFFFFSNVYLRLSCFGSISLYRRFGNGSLPCSIIEVNRRILFSAIHERTGAPLYRVLCPDWIEWAGILENVFSLLLHEQEEERHGLLTNDQVWLLLEFRAI